MNNITDKSIYSITKFWLDLSYIVLVLLVVFSVVGLICLGLFFPNLFADSKTESLIIKATGLVLSFKQLNINWHSQLLYSLGFWMLPRLMVYLIVVLLLKRIFKNFEGNSYFSAENARLIKWIGLTVIFGGILISFAESQLGKFWAEYISTTGIEIKPGKFHLIPFNSTLMGLVILVFGEIFKTGPPSPAEDNQSKSHIDIEV